MIRFSSFQSTREKGGKMGESEREKKRKIDKLTKTSK